MSRMLASLTLCLLTLLVACDSDSGSRDGSLLGPGLDPDGFETASLAAFSFEDAVMAIDEATLEVGPILNKRTSYLSMLANVATLLGLLGTIMGLIQAFEAVAHASAEMKQTLLAAGISVAMYTTAGGLIVAIPTLILHAIILARTNKILDDVDQYGLKTVNLLTARRRGGLKDEVAAEA